MAYFRAGLGAWSMLHSDQRNREAMSLPSDRRDPMPTDPRYASIAALAVLTGLLGAAGNVVFRAAIAGTGWLFQGRAAALGPAGIPAAVVAGGVVLLLLEQLFPGGVLSSSTPRFFEMPHFQRRRATRRRVVIKTLGAAISLGAGAAVGREGPIVQLGGSLGSAVAFLAHLSSKHRKVLIACGAAAGIATTFNAPIGALMFAHEIVLPQDTQPADFSLILVATITAVIAARGVPGSTPVFAVPPFTLASYWECVAYALLGVVLGLLAVFYMRLLDAVARGAHRLRVPRSAVLLGGLAVVGLLGMTVPGNLSDGYGLVNEALAGRLPWQPMALLAVAKIVGSSLSLGCGAPGGVFGPIFFIGAMAGGSFQALSALLLPGEMGPQGSYALVGLCTFFAATARAPLSAIFILFGMTGTYNVAIPAVISIVTTLMVTTLVEPTKRLRTTPPGGKNLRPTTEWPLHDRIPVGTVYRRGVETISENCPLPEISRIVALTPSVTFPVVDELGEVVGTLSYATLCRLHIEDAPPHPVARDLCDPHMALLTPDASLGEALRLMDAEGLENLPIVDRGDRRRLLGMLVRADLVPDLDRPLAAGDRLMLVGTAEDLSIVRTPSDWLQFDRCPLSGCHVDAGMAVEVEVRGHADCARACCLQCTIAYSQQTGNTVRVRWVTDYLTHKTIAPEDAWYIEGSDITPCAGGPPLAVGASRRGECLITRHRCEPSIIAFTGMSAARGFREEHGGRLQTFSAIVAGTELVASK
jgi:chloride channel protein, CIC family